jgi:DHA2 family multidrug resistance protein
MFSLSRNLGSSIGISVVETLLTRNTQTAHASLAEHVTPFTPLMHAQGPETVQRLSALNAQVTEQAAMIAYNDNFRLMFWLSLAAIPLLVLLRKGDAPRSAEAVAVE